MLWARLDALQGRKGGVWPEARVAFGEPIMRWRRPLAVPSSEAEGREARVTLGVGCALMAGPLALPTCLCLWAGNASATRSLHSCLPATTRASRPPRPPRHGDLPMSQCYLNGTTGKRRNQYYTNCFLIHGPSNFQ